MKAKNPKPRADDSLTEYFLDLDRFAGRPRMYFWSILSVGTVLERAITTCFIRHDDCRPHAKYKRSRDQTLTKDLPHSLV